MDCFGFEDGIEQGCKAGRSVNSAAWIFLSILSITLRYYEGKASGDIGRDL